MVQNRISFTEINLIELHLLKVIVLAVPKGLTVSKQCVLTHILIDSQFVGIVCRPVVVVLFQHIIVDVRLHWLDDCGSHGGRED